MAVETAIIIIIITTITETYLAIETTKIEHIKKQIEKKYNWIKVCCQTNLY